MKTSELFKLLHNILSSNEDIRCDYNKLFDEKDISQLFKNGDYIMELSKEDFISHAIKYTDTCGYTIICNSNNEMIACFGFDESLSEEFNESGLLYSATPKITNEKSLIKFVSKTKENIKIYFYNLFSVSDRKRNPYTPFSSD